MEKRGGKSISFDCVGCGVFQTVVFDGEHESIEMSCGECGREVVLSGLNQDMIEVCPVCSCGELHQHKDFNKKLGIGLFILGAVFAPWTYYLSLVGALALDAALYPLFPWMAVCYQCKSELRGWPKNPKLDRFNHETAAHYEYKKAS